VAKSQDAFKRFKFSKREKRGSIIFLLLLIGLMFLPRFFRTNQQPLVFEFTAYEKEQIEVLKTKSQNAKKQREKKFSSSKKFESKEFTKPLPTEPFDPDTMSAVSWQSLGLSERQAEVLISYKVRSGGFYQIDQLYSAYVLDSARVDAWKPFMVFNKKKPVEKKIEVNIATAEELKSLRGIGEKLSERIVTYREKLGGYVSVEQIAEVYGLSAETFESIKTKVTVDLNIVKTIEINHVEMKELAAHPYFTFQMAKLIVNYRLQHGPYSSMDELLKSKGIEIEDVTKVEPYINFAP
jgi:competence ComEA-like helix-hairpin-helix protein